MTETELIFYLIVLPIGFMVGTIIGVIVCDKVFHWF